MIKFERNINIYFYVLIIYAATCDEQKQKQLNADQLNSY